MFTKDYEWYIRHLTEHADMKITEVLFVDNIASWCRRKGIDETDEHKPLKIVTEDGARLLIAKMIPDQIMEERINATRIRSQLKSLGQDRADLAADEWIYRQLDRIGITNPWAMKVA
jgi:hypothetical protein